MITLGFTAAVSVRVSNELGANHPKAAKFSAIVAVTTSGLLGLVFHGYTRSSERNIKTRIPTGSYVLSGVAIGAGWQSLVAFVNIGCYYLVGLPIGAVLGFKLKLNAALLGIWSGMLIGSVLQTIILLFITFRTKWQKEVYFAPYRNS